MSRCFNYPLLWFWSIWNKNWGTRAGNLSDLQEKITSLKMQHSSNSTSMFTKGSRGEGERIRLALSKLKLQYSLQIKKYSKVNYPLGNSAGIFYGEKVGQDLLLASLCGRNSCQYGHRGVREPLSWAGRGSEERMVCARSGRWDFKKCHMFDAFVFLWKWSERWDTYSSCHVSSVGLMLTPVSSRLWGVLVQPGRQEGAASSGEGANAGPVMSGGTRQRFQNTAVNKVKVSLCAGRRFVFMSWTGHGWSISKTSNLYALFVCLLFGF